MSCVAPLVALKRPPPPPICASGAAGTRSAASTVLDVPVRYQGRRSSRGAVRCGTNGRRSSTAPLSPLFTHVENCRNFRAASAPNKASCSAAPILLGRGRRAPLCPLGRAGNGTAPGGRLPSPSPGSCGRSAVSSRSHQQPGDRLLSSDCIALCVCVVMVLDIAKDATVHLFEVPWGFTCCLVGRYSIW